ncbi:unnamed protein product [Linum trigynum]|uniref:Uncharacterized protein n=1 Tax=Linum trigynum TaxID=586398 RepID=A0AAV2E0R9_9ROSI
MGCRITLCLDLVRLMARCNRPIADLVFKFRGGRRNLMGLRAAGEPLAPQAQDMVASPQQPYPTCAVAALSNDDIPMAEVGEQTRRRRLILEVDSDDDEIDLAQSVVLCVFFSCNTAVRASQLAHLS